MLFFTSGLELLFLSTLLHGAVASSALEKWPCDAVRVKMSLEGSFQAGSAHVKPSIIRYDNGRRYICAQQLTGTLVGPLSPRERYVEATRTAVFDATSGRPLLACPVLDAGRLSFVATHRCAHITPSDVPGMCTATVVSVVDCPPLPSKATTPEPTTTAPPVTPSPSKKTVTTTGDAASSNETTGVDLGSGLSPEQTNEGSNIVNVPSDKHVSQSTALPTLMTSPVGSVIISSRQPSTTPAHSGAVPTSSTIKLINVTTAPVSPKRTSAYPTATTPDPITTTTAASLQHTTQQTYTGTEVAVTKDEKPNGIGDEEDDSRTASSSLTSLPISVGFIAACLFIALVVGGLVVFLYHLRQRDRRLADPERRHGAHNSQENERMARTHRGRRHSPATSMSEVSGHSADLAVLGVEHLQPSPELCRTANEGQPEPSAPAAAFHVTFNVNIDGAGNDGTASGRQAGNAEPANSPSAGPSVTPQPVALLQQVTEPFYPEKNSERAAPGDNGRPRSLHEAPGSGSAGNQCLETAYNDK